MQYYYIAHMFDILMSRVFMQKIVTLQNNLRNSLLFLAPRQCIGCLKAEILVATSYNTDYNRVSSVLPSRLCMQRQRPLLSDPPAACEAFIHIND